MKRLAMIASACALALVGAGCEKPGIKQVPVFPVQGELFAGNQPAAGAMLTLHPLDKRGETSLRSMAVVDQTGAFAFNTYVEGDGAPEGKFVLTVYWPDSRREVKDIDGESEHLAPDLFRGRFSDPNRSPLRVQVESKPNTLGRVDLSDPSIGKTPEFSIPQS